MYWLTERKESILNEACGDWKNCNKQKASQKSTKKEKKTNKKHEWLKGTIRNPFEDSVKIAKLVWTEDVKWR